MTRPTILMAPRLPDALVARLADHYTLLGPMERPTPDALPPGAEAARALLTLGGLQTSAELIDALPQLALICCYGTGVEGVDHAHAAARGVAVTNAADANANAVAEFAMGLLIATTRSITRGDRHVRSGGWRGNAVERMPLTAGIAGRKLGIYGLGAIGRRIATRSAAFDAEIGYHGRTEKPGLPYRYHDSLFGLAEWADILVVAVRASAETRHAVNADILKALGPQGHLVNVSRGVAVDETALCDALETGVIAGAGLDVYEREPHVPERLRVLDNVVLTPHMAANAQSAQRAQQDLMMANLAAFFAGRPLLSQVF